MTRIGWLALVTSAALIAACAESEDGPGNYPPPPESPGGETPGPGPGDPEPEPDPDPQPEPEPVGWSFDAIYGVPNLDDDDLDEGRLADWQQYLFDEDDDLSHLQISADLFAAGETIRLELAGDTDAVRVWHDGEPALGSAAAGNTYELTTAAGEDVELPIEFGTYNVVATLTVLHLDASGAEIESAEVTLRSAPLIMNHHLQPAERIYATRVQEEGYDNSDMIDRYTSILGSAFVETANGPNYGWDVWMQDEFEFATATGNQGQRLDVVIDSVRDRGLDDFAEDAMVEPGVTTGVWGSPGLATTYDSFGNLEASPPVTVNGVEYPFGRIYFGRKGNEGMQPGLADFLSSQNVQDPFEIDTTWLCVGHVDEFSTFIPDPSSAKGFKLVVVDIPAAYALLDAANPNTSLPRYAADKGFDTIGDIVDDDNLRILNTAIQNDYITPITNKFKAELGLTDADIIKIPGMFEVVSRCGGGVGAFFPGTANLIVATDEAGAPHLFVPDPFMRSNLSAQNTDPIINDFIARMPAGLDVQFVDDWDVYHMGIGEVHCGSNVRRTPTGNWWELASHLLGGL